MTQRLFMLLLIGLMVAPLAAQAPPGMKVRVDRSTSASDPDDTPNLKIVTAGKGFRVTGGPAAILWKPDQAATGNYTLRATFNLMKPSGHVNYYGLVFGGSDLNTATEAYTYFIVAQDGAFQIRQRAGEAVTNVVAKTPHAAVRKPGEQGESSNALEVRVSGDTVSYVINGTVVHTMPKGTMKTEGIVGVRINHQLDVQVDGFEVSK
jgi:hypothetical protein